ncbi:MAG: SMP-30/gluconolactonase/LRE family protein [Gammaproteobacteria bacterium]|nr:SMP-30/gluconolactonase/LRE family protein [Gammaproteobacteria bacterium]MBU1440249.1 SMP-30/gluconolactonase/LRE family protein [Gammaproteobacteria bacterium]MBU2408600.1 SMP-30/gluconolactonase/LRE family protein [Gammaproteobacteria bacterium]
MPEPTASGARAPIRVIAEGLQFPEGPVAMQDGSVIVVEIRGGTVKRIAPDGTVSLVADCGGGPNGAAIGPDGALYVCNNGGASYVPGQILSSGPAADYTGGSIQRIDLASGEVRVLYDSCNGIRLSAPNDLVFDRDGGFYFSDMGKKKARERVNGGLYYAKADGSEIRELAYPMQQPNGVALSPDQRTVYVAETDSSRLWAFDVVSPGRIAKGATPPPHGGRLVCGLPGYQGFDSMAVEAGGNICVATLTTGHITVIAPSGEVVERIEVPDTHVTNICFGGPDLKTAYMTFSGNGQLATMPWPRAGLALNCAG